MTCTQQHPNCARVYPCLVCYERDHPGPACGHRLTVFLSSLCAEHEQPLPEMQPCEVCGAVVPVETGGGR